MEVIKDFLFLCVQTCIMILIFWGVFRYEFQEKLRYYIILGIVVIAMPCLNILKIVEDVIYINLLFKVVCTMLVFKGRFLKKFGMYVIGYFTYDMLQNTVVIILAAVLRVSPHYMWNKVGNYNWYALMTFFVIMVGIILLLRLRFHSKILDYRTLERRYFWIVLITLALSSTVAACIQGVILGEDTVGTNQFMIWALIGVAIISIAIIVMLLVLVRSRNFYRQLNDALEENAKIQENYYNRIEETNQKVKSFRHDYNNHLSCIKHLSKQGDYKELEKYLEGLDTVSNNLKMSSHTGNKIVDAVLNEIEFVAGERGIDFKVMGHITRDLTIQSLDLCSLISNALKNALEATEKAADSNIEKIITVEFQSSKTNLFITITNPSLTAVTSKKGLMKTSKADKENHGYGTKNMRRIIEKYQGNLEWIWDENQVRTELILNYIIE